MEQYFCPKCVNATFSPACNVCNKDISASRCYCSESVIYPYKDRVRLGLVFKLSAYVSIAVLLILSVLELVLRQGDFLGLWSFLAEGGILVLVMQLFCAMLVVGFLILLLQGREITQYRVEMGGVLKKTWIVPSPLKCWSRLISMRESVIAKNAQGEPYLLVHSAYLRFSDADRARASGNGTRLRLYHPYNFLFMDVVLDRTDVEHVYKIPRLKTLLSK